jgi:hypothetical protein
MFAISAHTLADKTGWKLLVMLPDRAARLHL